MTLRPSLPNITASLGQAQGRRGITLLLVLLSLASAIAWAWAAQRLAAPLSASTAPAAPPAPAVALLGEAELARLLGDAGTSASEPVPGPGSRFVLLGVIAGASGQGAALIAVDGQPARPFRVGMAVAPGFVLQRVAAREVMLADTPDGPVKLTLPLPAWEPAPPSPRPTPVPDPEVPVEAKPSAPVRRAEPSGP